MDDTLYPGLVQKVLMTGTTVVQSRGATRVSRSFVKTDGLTRHTQVVMAVFPSGKQYLVGRR